MDWEAAKELFKQKVNLSSDQATSDSISDDVPKNRRNNKNNIFKQPHIRKKMAKQIEWNVKRPLGTLKPSGFISVVGNFPKTQAESPKKIEFLSKRATYTSNYYTCRNCHSEKAHWHYSETNVGPIYLCSRCKDFLSHQSEERVTLSLQ